MCSFLRISQQCYMDVVNNTLSVLRTNPYVSSSVSLFLILYAGLAAPALPASVAGLFEHSVFKTLIMVLILVLLREKNFTTALLVAIGFMVSMTTLSRYRARAMVTEFGSNNKDTEWSANQGEGTNRVTLRGHEYVGSDEPNHLPGGHGPDETPGYDTGDFASYGTKNSQL